MLKNLTTNIETKTQDFIIFVSILQLLLNVFSLNTILQTFGLILFIVPRYFINFRFDFIRYHV